MAIYNKQGQALSTAYGKNGLALIQAYDKSGNPLLGGGLSLKVMSYNCGQWYDGGHDNVPADKDSDYFDLQTGMIEQANPDILCLCEYTKQFSKAGRTALSVLQPFFQYIHEQGGDSVTDVNGRCIASKYPITNYATHVYSTSGAPQYFDSCTITIDGVPLTVVVTHLHYSATNTNRFGQLNELIAFLQTQSKFVACGDYNMLDCKSESGVDYINMMQPILNAGFHAANCTDFGFIETYSDQPIGTYTGCLDNIITSANIDIVSAERDATKLSDDLTERTDHMPLIAVVKVPR